MFRVREKLPPCILKTNKYNIEALSNSKECKNRVDELDYDRIRLQKRIFSGNGKIKEREAKKYWVTDAIVHMIEERKLTKKNIQK